jgi:hypothetical protein
MNQNSIESIMQRKHASVSLIQFVSCAAFALVAVTQVQAAEEKKADPAGTWTWSTPGRQGGPDRTNSLVIKVEGDKVTGKLSAPGRGGQATDTDIKDAKMKGDELSFVIIRERGGNSFTNKYSGKITGDSLKGKMEFVDQNGETQSRDFEAKRAGMKK